MTTIASRVAATRSLAKCKLPGESFSDLLDREFDRKIETAEDLLAWGRANRGKRNALTQRKAAKSKAA